MMLQMDFPCLWPRGCSDPSTERVKLVEVVDRPAHKSADNPPRRLQLLFCRAHAEQLMTRDEWFGPSLGRDEGWFVGVKFDHFDLSGVLAGQTAEALLMGRAVGHMIGLVS
jgi:hypothetical protein